MKSRDEGDKFLDKYWNYLVALYFTLVNTIYFMSISKIEPIPVIEIIGTTIFVNALAAIGGFIVYSFDFWRLI